MNELLAGPEAQAVALHAKAIVFDGLCSGPRMNTYRDHRTTSTHLDDLLEGGLSGGNLTITHQDSLDGAIRRIADWLIKLDKFKDRLVHAKTPEDVVRAKREGKFAVVFGLQNTQQMDRDLGLLHVLHTLGLRILQLTYNERNYVGDGCTEPGDIGLSDFGRRLVPAMNALGMVIDLTHVGRRTSLEAIELSQKPCIFSHSSCRALCDNKRNITDEQMQAVAAKGGMVGICAFPTFITWDREPTLEHMLDHIDHAVNLIGVDHVGIGTDMFTGKSFKEFQAYDYDLTVYPAWPWPLVKDFEDATKWPNMTQGLLRRGHGEEDVLKILGGNFLRVWGEIQRV